MNRLALFNNTSTVDGGSAGVTDPTEVPDQQIAIFDADDLSKGTLALNGANATDRMLIVQGDDKSPFVTQVIEKSQIKRVISKDFQAYVNQVTHVGFAGSGSGAISSSVGDAYAKITRLDKGFEQFPRTTAHAKILSGDNQYDIANKLATDFNAKSGAKAFVDADVLVNASSSQLVDTATTPANVTLDVTYGSKIAIANVTSGADVNAAVGDYLRIGSAATLTDPVYKITAIESNSGAQTELQITLDRAYAGDTADAVAAGKLDSSDLSATDAGVEITAKDLEDVSDFVESNAAISFTTSLNDNLEGTPVAIGTTPKTGSGTFRQLRYVEEQAAGMQHSFFYRNYFPQTPEFYADDAKNYDVVVLVVELNNDNAVVNQNRYLEIVLAWDEAANIGTQLETFFGVS